jgi:hypothetical protein
MKNYKLILIFIVILFAATACGGDSGTPSIQGKGSPERLE